MNIKKRTRQKKQRYCVYHDISQDFSLKVVPMDKDGYCHGKVIYDDGRLMKKLATARAKLRGVSHAIEKAAAARRATGGAS